MSRNLFILTLQSLFEILSDDKYIMKTGSHDLNKYLSTKILNECSCTNTSICLVSAQAERAFTPSTMRSESSREIDL